MASAPIAIVTTSVTGIVLNALARRAMGCFMQARKLDEALIIQVGRKALCERLYSLADMHFQCVDVEAETLASLSEDRRALMKRIQAEDTPTLYARLLSIYARAYIKTLKNTFLQTRFLFLVNSYQMARDACCVGKSRTRVAVPSRKFNSELKLVMGPKEQAVFETTQLESVRLTTPSRMIVFDSWNMLVYNVTQAYGLSVRL
jgi:hypothetical protein